MKLYRALLLFLLAVPALALAEATNPPERLARLSYVEGEVKIRGAQEPATTTLPERPLAPGDRLITGTGGRAELALGTATIRLDEQSELSFVDLDATTTRVELTTGAASVYVHELLEDETFEIVTPNTTITLDEPGEYRADVFADNATALTVRNGAASAATAGGPVRVAAGQLVRLEGRDAVARLESPKPVDSFDDWVFGREQRLAEAEAPRYTPYEGDDNAALDNYGEWYDEPGYGRVWMPSYAYGGYDPFRYGYWQRVGLGWSWFDSVPWGFYTFHSGRWAYSHRRNRWCWVPEHHRDHPRQVAGDTRPFGQPRGNTGGRVDRQDAPRTADSPSNAGDTHQPVYTHAPNDGTHGGIMKPAGNRQWNPSPPVASKPQPSGTTMRPSRADPPARAAATPNVSQRKTTFGAQPTP